MSKDSKNGFTLIELLVVIAIIALLLSVIVPALGLVKKKAQALVCKSNLSQWGLCAALYVQDNDGSFMDPAGGLWVVPLAPYFGDGSTKKIRLCPTTKPDHPDPFFEAWTVSITSEPDYSSSYGINNWIYNPTTATLWGKDTTLNWRKLSNIPSSMNTPLFIDCWRWGGSPYEGETPIDPRPQTMAELIAGSLNTNEINRFCLDRHQGTVNTVYADTSASSVTLRGLWGLKWYKEYRPGAEVERMNNAGWPDWMKK